jgi:predicted phosphoribosyltransferase/dienelactone hydrolase
VTFRDRTDAGRQLAERLGPLRTADLVVLGVPRGGVPVAAEVAAALDAPLDVIVVRKLGVPLRPELAAGAVGEGGVRVLNQDVVETHRMGRRDLDPIEARERTELDRRTSLVRRSHPRLSLTGRTAVVVDDGIATGATARAACQVARAHGAARVVLAVPTAPAGWQAEMGDTADTYVSLVTPEQFVSVGQWYRSFEVVDDDEMLRVLDRAAARGWEAAIPIDPQPSAVRAQRVVLDAHVTMPARAGGVVVFAHGSGSSRHSPRNAFVADVLEQAGVGTVLVDLLTEREADERANVFDIDLLAHRLRAVTRWVERQWVGVQVQLGLFGASTGAAAALAAAADPDAHVSAVVSRGGRPDLARRHLAGVRAPTLLIVGSRDDVVLDLNRQAAELLRCEHRLEIVPGASHLFEEPGTLQRAATLAADWFASHLRRASVRV